MIQYDTICMHLGAQVSTNAWSLKRLNSTFNRICGRPHRPRSEAIRRLMVIAGVPIPEASAGEDDEESSWEEGEEEEDFEDDAELPDDDLKGEALEIKPPPEDVKTPEQAEPAVSIEPAKLRRMDAKENQSCEPSPKATENPQSKPSAEALENQRSEPSSKAAENPSAEAIENQRSEPEPSPKAAENPCGLNVGPATTAAVAAPITSTGGASECMIVQHECHACGPIYRICHSH